MNKIKKTKILNYYSIIIVLSTLIGCNQKKIESLEWVKTIGSAYFDECYDISVDELGNTYFTGVFSDEIKGQQIKSNGALDIVIGKLNKFGDIEWIKSFGGTKDDEAYCIVTDKKNVYVSGYFSEEITTCDKKFNSIGAGDAFLLKLSKSGEEIAFHVFGSKGQDEAVTLQITDKNEVLVGGFFELELEGFPQIKSNGGVDAFIAKLGTDDKILEIKNFGGKGNDKFFCNKKTENKTSIFAGSMFCDSTQKEDNWVVTIDEQLTIKSSFTFGSKAYDQINSIDVLNDNIIVSGEYRNGEWNILGQNTQLAYRNYSDAFVASFSKNQTLNWIKTISSSKHEWAKGLCVTNGKIYASSEFNDSAFVAFENNKMFRSKGIYDVYIAELNEQGEIVNKALIQGKGEDGVNKLFIYENYFYTCGWTYDTAYFYNQKSISNGEGDLYIWKCKLNEVFKNSK